MDPLENSKEALLFTILVDWANESTDRKLEWLAPMLVLCKRKLTEQEYREYLNLLQIDLTDYNEYELVKQATSLMVGGSIIELEELLDESLVDTQSNMYLEGLTSEKLREYKAEVEFEAEQMAKAMELE